MSCTCCKVSNSGIDIPAPDELWRSDLAGPLAGLRVLDMTSLLPGPYLTHMLASLGASVLKVESPRGDNARWLPPLDGQGANETLHSPRFRALNTGKTSVAIDLRTDEGRARVEELLGQADVFVEGFRPGALAKHGLSPKSVLSRHPHMVYASLSGFGQHSETARSAGHDIGFIARSGILSVNVDSAGTPTVPPYPLADLGGGSMPGAFGIMAALWEKDRSGKGQHIDISLSDASLQWGVMQLSTLGADANKEQTSAQDPIHYGVYECLDGWVTIGSVEEKFWHAFCAGIERPDLVNHHHAVVGSWAHEELKAVFKERTRSQWATFNTEHDCCVEPVATLEEAAVRLEKENRGHVYQDEFGNFHLGSPIGFSRSVTNPATQAPALGVQSQPAG